MEEVERLVDEGVVDQAVLKARQIGAQPAELWRVVQKQIGRRRYDRASRLIEDLQLGANDPQSISDFVLRALVDSQFSIAVKWSLTLNGQRPNPQDCVAVAIQKDCVELALKYISELNLEGFDVAMLIDRLCQQENLAAARRYILRFNLEERFPPEAIVELMFQAGQWDNALSLINQIPKLKSTFSGLAFLERIVRARDWIASIRFAQQFGIPAQSTSVETLNPAQRTIVRMMIEGMVRDGKLYQAMRLVFAHQFQNEYQPVQLIRTMIKERQYAHALRFIKALNLDADFEDDVAKIQRERLRELGEFRNLMSLRKKNSRPALNDNEPKVVVAQLFLGARVFVRRLDGKLVLASNLASGMAPSTSPVDSQLRASDAHDDDDEEIVFASAPTAQAAHAGAPRGPPMQQGQHQPAYQGYPPPPMHAFRPGPGPGPNMIPSVPGFPHMVAPPPPFFPPVGASGPRLAPQPGFYPLQQFGGMAQMVPGPPHPPPVSHLLQHPSARGPTAHQFAGIERQQQVQHHRDQVAQKQEEHSLGADAKKSSQQQSRKVLMPSKLF